VQQENEIDDYMLNIASGRRIVRSSTLVIKGIYFNPSSNLFRLCILGEDAAVFLSSPI
jgi:hypothetical protein